MHGAGRQPAARVRAGGGTAGRRAALALTEIDLWDDLVADGEEIGPSAFAAGVTIVRNVVRPTLTPYLPTGSTSDVAVIVAPGGAYRFLAIEHEGHAVARWLCERGIAAYVLKYRTVLMSAAEDEFRTQLGALFTAGRSWTDDIVDLLPDGPQAVRRVRERHAQVVMMGFSAGAKLTIETLWSDAPPDAAALIYPPPVTDHDTAPADAPPLFALMANDDPLTTAGVTRLHELWRGAGRPVDVHLFARGGHGFGTNPQGLPVDRWLELVGDWLDSVMAPAR